MCITLADLDFMTIDETLTAGIIRIQADKGILGMNGFLQEL